MRHGGGIKGLLPVIVMAVAVNSAGAQQREPIIDVHLHAYTQSQWRPGLANPSGGEPAPATAEEQLRQSLAQMDRYNIVLAAVSGSLEAVEAWRRLAPQRVLAAPLFGRAGFDDFDKPLPGLDSLRALYRNGTLKVMGEITAQYEGLSPSDSTLDPYFALAEELGIPVGIHTGTGPERMPYRGKPNFRIAMGNPLLLEDLLVRRPKLRVYMMHGGLPWKREALDLMRMYPQLYMDIAVIDWIGGPKSIPRLHAFLREAFAAGLGKRIMFGTDQMRWPDAIPMAIQAVEAAEFLTHEQKRDIFYNNAARFLGLSDADVARHHAFGGAGAPRETTLQIPSGGKMLPATLYHAAGTGPHPTVAWFHGFPGLPRPTPATIARLRDSGVNVLYVHYRGSWGASGTFSAAHALEDASAVLAFLRDSGFAAANRIDPARVIPVGDSFGSWVALMTAAADSLSPCVAAAVVTNLGQLGTAFATDTALRAGFTQVFAAVASDTALGYRFTRGPDRFMDDIIAGRARNDLVTLANALRDRPVLLIGAERDEVAPPAEHLAPLSRALEAAGGTKVTQRMFPGGHELPDASYAGLLGSWIRGNCAG